MTSHDETPDNIPEDRERLTKRELGLYEKYFVMRGDNQDSRGGKHFGCKHFVIDFTCDKYAREVMLKYAELCEHEYPVLARDIRAQFSQTTKGNTTNAKRRSKANR